MKAFMDEAIPTAKLLALPFCGTSASAGVLTLKWPEWWPLWILVGVLIGLIILLAMGAFVIFIIREEFPKR